MTSLKTPFKDLTSFKGNSKRPYREHLDYAPIKKRFTAEMNMKRRAAEAPARAAKVKRERVEERPEPDGGAKALDLSPGLKHTLAQFTLSSQSSLGGPAAFSAKSARDSASPAHPAPAPSPPVPAGGPLLVPCDSSTELTHALLEGESISCFAVGGEKRLCLPQVLNSVLRDFSLQQINGVCDELYVYCSRCDAEQLHILKVLGILPFNAPSCGLITLTDAQRLCNALLRPGAALPPDPSGKLPGRGLLEEGRATFQVEHHCLGKCQGLFVPQFYARPDAPCVQCVECRLLFSPQNFVMHSHKSSDKRTCHWGFDSAKWPCYLLLGRKYLGAPEEARLRQLLEEMKEKFHHTHKKDADEDRHVRKSSPDRCSSTDKLSDDEPGRKGKSHSSLAFSHSFPSIKEEPGHDTPVHPSYYLYLYDKMLPPNVSLRKDAVSQDVLGALLKQHYSSSSSRPALDHPTKDQQFSPPIAYEPKSQRAKEDQCLAAEVAAATRKDAYAPAEASSKDGGGAALEDDKDRIVLEIVQMYSRQQEKLNATLQKQLQLEMELEALRGGSAAQLRELCAERGELQTELEAMHTEHAQRLGELQHEQTELESRLEQLRQQDCGCGAQEAQYTAQLCKLRARLELVEVERAELQEELQREREAREKLERTVSQLRQQMARSGPPAPGTPTPSSTPSPQAPEQLTSG
ncbi:ski-like protein [Denticeps clupeoides]|uniref:c-SKI SMAD4-binding domain-containing protein n=1 Tax=Denticeps clupeoides TaxID=299321 RepID=A0AAY3ZX76_9TELE|nr:ski-like protein [Denticeps clupeoides]XP_028834299.1 ski-like protein [Denticeps clupeoides]